MRTLVTPVGVSPYLSLNAYNFWWLVNDAQGWVSDTGSLLGPVTFRHGGLLLLLAAIGLALLRLHHDTSRSSIIIASA